VYLPTVKDDESLTAKYSYMQINQHTTNLYSGCYSRTTKYLEPDPCRNQSQLTVTTTYVMKTQRLSTSH